MKSLRSERTMTQRNYFAIATTFLLVAVAPFHFHDARAQQGEESISLELNKLEPSETGCRAYIVISNTSGTAYDAFKLDLVMFKKDGIIGRRFALNLAPMRPSKRTVKLFDLDDTKCEDIGSFLVNDVMDCRAGEQTDQDCLARLNVKSLNSVEISK